MRKLIIVTLLLLAILGAFGDNGNGNGNGNVKGDRNNNGKGNDKGNGNGNGKGNGNGNGNGNRNGNGNGSGNENGNGMSVGYYSKKCRDVEDIVQKIVWQMVTEKPALAPILLRLHYHDCFVRGCEGSVLLDSPTNSSEKAAIPNRNLGGYDVIDTIKTSLEQVCPGIVSCADIVALAARDAVSFQFRRRMWEVYTGREDGVVSLASEAVGQLPSPFANFPTLLTNFQNKKLNLVDLVALSGAHTIGISRCRFIGNRLYNFSGKGDTDPDLDPNYAEFLKTNICSRPLNPNTILEMDPNSNTTFDSDYFRSVRQRKGLFTSDAQLLKDPVSFGLVQLYQNNEYVFLSQFGKSMVNMGNIGVLTNGQGQIRLKCNVVNPPIAR